MSRAFTKEIDDAPVPPLHDRAISGARNLVIPSGARQIEQSIATLNERIGSLSDATVVAETVEFETKAGEEEVKIIAIRRDAPMDKLR